MPSVATGIPNGRYKHLDPLLPTKQVHLEDLPEFGLVIEQSINSRRRIHRYPGPPGDDERQFLPVCPTGRRKTHLSEDLDWQAVHDSWQKIRLRQRLPFDTYLLCQCIECFRGLEVIYPVN